MKKLRRKLPVLLMLFTGIFWGGVTYAQTEVTVHGTIISAEDDQPLVGATIIAGPANATTADINGAYSITVPPSTTLAFQYIGCTTQNYTVPAGSGSLTHDVRMESDTQSIDDVVVIAYGTRKKGTIAGSVSTIKADKIKDVPAASFDQALQGQTPGLTVLSNSGEPGVASSFQIRGTNSINSGTTPLFILDGMPISANDFNAISSADIESVSVLKDASSTSIYGARAANGVVVITTKRGRMSQDAQVSFRMQLGFSQLAQDNWNMMNTTERIAYEKEVGLDAGKNYDKLSMVNVNWLDEVFNKTALLQSYDVQVSGATDKVRYYISGSYFDQDGIAIDSDFKRYNIRANVEAQAKKWLKVGTNLMFTHEKIQQADAGDYTTVTPISAARFMMPYWSPYREDGSLASVSDGSWKGTNQNPLEWAENNPAKNSKNKLIGSLFLEASPIEGLTIRSQGGLDYSHIVSSASSMPSYRPNNGQGTVGRSTSAAYNLSITNTINYHFDLNHLHDFNFMVGQEGINYSAEGFSVTTSGQKNDRLTNISSGTRARSWADNSSAYSYVSFFGRGEYNYNNRYYADFSVRTDGSSRFGTKGRWAGFWSVGLMWNMRNEKFMENAKWLTTAQLAFSTGTSGNSSIPNYDHLALIGGGLDYMGDSGIAPMSKGNEDLEWEKLWTTNIGLHLGFVDRIQLDIELYNKQTTNMLMAVPVSYADAGYGARWDNVGGMSNRGIEFNINADLIRTKNITWNVNANASYNKNEITELYNGVQEYVVSTSGTKLVVGHSYGEFYMNRYAGVNPANGDPLWYDKEGNITNEYRESDKVMTGHSYIAPWQGGFGTTFTWKGLSLSAQFSWVGDRWMMNNDRYFEENSTFDAFNQSRRMLNDRWKHPGDMTSIPRHGVTPQFDTHLLEDASFLRLKNLTLGYTLPASLLRKTQFIAGARVYVQAQNLFTFTEFSGLDPESSSNIYGAQYPMSRQFTFGLELTF